MSSTNEDTVAAKVNCSQTVTKTKIIKLTKTLKLTQIFFPKLIIITSEIPNFIFFYYTIYI